MNLSATDPEPNPLPNFYGYADASLRQDPNAPNYVWATYSYLNEYTGAAQAGSCASEGSASSTTDTVETHVAYSKDHGKTWTYAGKLFPTGPYCNPETKQTEWLVYEVSNIRPMSYRGVTYWYAEAQSYLNSIGCIQAGTCGSSNTLDATRFTMVGGIPDSSGTQGPMVLAPYVGNPTYTTYLGSYENSQTYFPAQNITTMVGYSNCSAAPFREGSIIISPPTLYFQTSCGDLSGIWQIQASIGNAVPAAAGSLIFSNTATTGWGTYAQASVLCNYVSDCSPGQLAVTQGDYAFDSSTSKWYAILSVTQNAGQKVSYGCVLVEINGITPLAFTNPTSPVVDAVAESPLSTNGPGSCTYEPAATFLGVVIAGKTTPPFESGLMGSQAP